MKKLLVILSIIGLSAFAQTQTRGSRGKRKPPREAVEACSGMQSGDTCSFQHRDRSLTGTCFAPKSDLALACKPARK